MSTTVSFFSKYIWKKFACPLTHDSYMFLIFYQFLKIVSFCRGSLFRFLCRNPIFGEFQDSFFLLELDLLRVPVRKQKIGTRQKSGSVTKSGRVTKDLIFENTKMNFQHFYFRKILIFVNCPYFWSIVLIFPFWFYQWK